MILIIDNYDSFTYNVVQLFQSRGEEVLVKLNDSLIIADIRKMNPEAIILSPGPGTPDDAGICLEVVKQLYKEYPIFGVCLGHQVIGQAFDAKVVNAGRIQHGKLDNIRHEGQGIFKGINSGFQASRYHSLIIDETSLTQDLEVLAKAISDDKIMAIRHKKYPVYGVQFHPESFGTRYGEVIADNFINIMRGKKGV